MRALLLFALVATLAFASPPAICPPAPVPSYMDITVDEAYGKIIVKVYNISGNYDKMPIKNALVYRVNLSGLQKDPPVGPDVCYDVTDNEGKIVHEYNASTQRCIDYWYIFCPLDANTAECLNKSGVSPLPLSYSSVRPCTTQKTPLQYINYLPSHNEFYICNTPTIDLAPLCWPLMLIFSLLLGASFAAGRNPFSFFDFSAPRMGRGRQYSMRVQQKSFDIIQYLMGADKIVSDASGGKYSLTGQLGKLIANVIAKAAEFLEKSYDFLYFKMGGLTDAEKKVNAEVLLDNGRKALSDLKDAKGKVQQRIRELESKQNLSEQEKKELKDLQKSLKVLDKEISKVEERIKALEKRIENLKNKIDRDKSENIVKTVQNKQTREAGDEGKIKSEGGRQQKSEGDKTTTVKRADTAIFTAQDLLEAVKLFFTGLSSQEQERVAKLEKDMKNFMESVGAGENASTLKRVGAALLFGLKESLNLDAFSSDQWRKTLLTVLLEWLAFRERGRRRGDFLEKLVEKIEKLAGKDAFLFAAYVNEPARLPLGLNIFQNAIKLVSAEVEKAFYSKDAVILGNIVEKDGKKYFYVELIGKKEEGKPGKALLIDIQEKSMKEINPLTQEEKGKVGFLVFDSRESKFILSSDNKEVAQYKKNEWRYNAALLKKMESLGASRELQGAMAAYVESQQDSYKALKQGDYEEIKRAFVVERTAKERLESLGYFYELGDKNRLFKHHLSQANNMTDEQRAETLKKLNEEYAKKKEEAEKEGNAEKAYRLKLELDVLNKVYTSPSDSNAIGEAINKLENYAKEMVDLGSANYLLAVQMQKGTIDAKTFSEFYNASAHLREAYAIEIEAERAGGIINKIWILSNEVERTWRMSLIGGDNFENIKTYLNVTLDIIKDEIYYKEPPLQREKKLETKKEIETNEVERSPRYYIAKLENDPTYIKKFRSQITMGGGLCDKIRKTVTDENVERVEIRVSVPTECYEPTFVTRYNLFLGNVLMTEIANNSKLKEQIKGNSVGNVKFETLKETLLNVSTLDEERVLSLSWRLNKGECIVFAGNGQQFTTYENTTKTLENGKIYVAVLEEGLIKIYENGENAKVQFQVTFIPKTGKDVLDAMRRGMDFKTIKNEVESIDVLDKKIIQIGEIKDEKEFKKILQQYKNDNVYFNWKTPEEATFIPKTGRDVLNAMIKRKIDFNKIKNEVESIDVLDKETIQMENIGSKEEFEKILRPYNNDNVYFNWKRSAEESKVRDALYGEDYYVNVSETRIVTKQIEVPGEVKKSWDPGKDSALLLAEITNSLDKAESLLRPYASFADKRNAIQKGYVSLSSDLSIYDSEGKMISWEKYKSMSPEEKEKIWFENMKKNQNEELSIVINNLEQGIKEGYSSEVIGHAEELKRVANSLSMVIPNATPKNYENIEKSIDKIKEIENALYKAPSGSDLIMFGKRTYYEREMLAETSPYWIGRSTFLTDHKFVTETIHGQVDREEYKKKIDENINNVKVRIEEIKQQASEEHNQLARDEIQNRIEGTLKSSAERRMGDTWKKLEEESRRKKDN